VSTTEAVASASFPVLRIHPQGGLPLYQQIKHQLSYLITTNRLPGGSRLPTVRSLAADLAINQHTVGQAYRELQQEGLIESYPGRGTFVRHFNDVSAAESARMERLTELLRCARRRGRALGFSDHEIEQHLVALANHEPEWCRVVFVDRVPHIARKYAARLEHHLGGAVRATALPLDAIEEGTPASVQALAESHYVFAFARNVPALERLLGANGGGHELVTIVSEVVPQTVATLAAQPRGTRAVLLTEERFVHAALDLIARHSEIDPAEVVAFTEDDVSGFVAAAANAEVAFYTFGVAQSFDRAELLVPSHELVFDVSPDSLRKLDGMLG
jgi:GntR family transcriptional regulator